MKRIMFVVACLSLSQHGVAAPPGKSKVISRQHVEVDGQRLRVVKFANGSVKVIQAGVFGHGPSFGLRERLRKAVPLATGCEITDDYFADGAVIGVLKCPSSPNGGATVTNIDKGA